MLIPQRIPRLVNDLNSWLSHRYLPVKALLCTRKYLDVLEMLLYYQDYVDSDIMSIIRFSSLLNVFSLLGFTFAHVSINLEKDEIKF